MTTYYAISGAPPQFELTSGVPASGYVLKAYSAGTSTNIAMATDYTGATTANTITLNSSGYPAVSGNVIIPHLAENYKLALFASQAAADSNTGAVWTIDNNQIGASVSSGSLTTVASSATISLNSESTNYFDITGTTTITSITLNNGSEVIAKFADSLVLTHGSFLILPYSENITTKAGDIARFRGESGGIVRLIDYQRETGQPLRYANIPYVQDFRLTLTTGTPVTTSDVASSTTLYCCPYKGNRIALYDGTNWNLRASAEFSIALGTLTNAIGYDVFCYDNAGVPTLELTAWSSATARATALVYQDGILVKSGAATRRYLGSFYTTSTTTTADSASTRALFNYYHRLPRNMLVTDATASWNYTTATIRQANANTANRLAFFVGVDENPVQAEVVARFANSSANVNAIVGIGLDSTTAINTNCIIHDSYSQVANINTTARASYSGNTGIGFHQLNWLEYSAATGTTTWTATSAVSAKAGGIRGIVYG